MRPLPDKEEKMREKLRWVRPLSINGKWMKGLFSRHKKLRLGYSLVPNQVPECGTFYTQYFVKYCQSTVESVTITVFQGMPYGSGNSMLSSEIACHRHFTYSKFTLSNAFVQFIRKKYRPNLQCWHLMVRKWYDTLYEERNMGDY